MSAKWNYSGWHGLETGHSIIVGMLSQLKKRAVEIEQ